MGQHTTTRTMGRRGADSARAFHVYFSTEGDSVDYPQYSVYDAGEMPNEVMITATCEFGDGDGTLCMFGGNNYDSWQAGYMVYKAADQVWFCVQMNANGSDGPIMSESGDWNGVHDVTAQYRNGYASLWIDGEVVAEGERNWVPAEGGMVSLINICRNGGKRFRRFKRVIAISNVYIATQ